MNHVLADFETITMECQMLDPMLTGDSLEQEESPDYADRIINAIR